MNKNCPGPDYCFESWCYVDPVVCTGSKFLMRGTDVILEGEGAYYSYETCGGEDEAWQVNKNELAMKGKAFRVGVPAASYPLHYLEHKLTGARVESGPWPLATDLDMSKYDAKCIYIDVFEEMKKIGDFEMELVPTSNASMALSRRMEENAWTACTYDVARGVVDLCLGEFWATKERIERGISMASAFVTEEMYIIGFEQA